MEESKKKTWEEFLNVIKLTEKHMKKVEKLGRFAGGVLGLSIALFGIGIIELIREGAFRGGLLWLSIAGIMLGISGILVGLIANRISVSGLEISVALSGLEHIKGFVAEYIEERLRDRFKKRS